MTKDFTSIILICFYSTLFCKYVTLNFLSHYNPVFRARLANLSWGHARKHNCISYQARQVFGLFYVAEGHSITNRIYSLVSEVGEIASVFDEFHFY